MKINLENKSGAKSDYRIESVKEIFLLEAEDNIHEGLKITTTGNQDILLKFRSTIQTSMLDGTIKK